MEKHLKTTIKINEKQLRNIVSDVINEILFNSLPKHDPSGNMYHTMLTGKPYIVNEGLIHSYPIDNVIFALTNLFDLSNTKNEEEKKKILYFLDKNQKLNNKNGIITLNKYSQNNTERIEIIVNENDFNQNDFDRYLLKYGWFCSVSGKLDSYDNLLRFIYEKKFDVDVTDMVKARKYLYHICPDIYLNKINRVGLKPKISSWNTYSNPERVYFFLKELSHKDFLKWVYNFMEGKNFNYNKTDGWAMLKINIDTLTNNPTFYFDPRMKEGVYTTDTILPENIEIVDYISKDTLYTKKNG